MNFTKNLKILLILKLEKQNPKDQLSAKDKIKKSNLKFPINLIKIIKTFILSIFNKKKNFITFRQEYEKDKTAQ